jgi:hypothetical protein
MKASDARIVAARALRLPSEEVGRAEMYDR